MGGGIDAGSLGATFSPNRAVVTGMRGITTPAAAQTLQLHNGGASALQLTRLALGGANAALFQINSPPSLPVSIMPGGNLAVTIQMTTTGNTLPAAPANTDDGSTFLTANLTATFDSGVIQIPTFGLVLMTNAAGSPLEPTLGQVLTTLGFPLRVGAAQTNWNPNRGRTAAMLPGVEAGTDEVAAQLFVKAGTGNVTLVPIARFSPKGPLDFGWYPPGAAGMRNAIAKMGDVADPQTTDKARMVYPPLTAGGTTSFDPGANPFGIWVYTDQASHLYDTGDATNGDYNYSQDALNLPAPTVHRFKAYPLRDGNGPVANTYLLAVEEASNGDYQDYVFVLGNVRISP